MLGSTFTKRIGVLHLAHKGVRGSAECERRLVDEEADPLDQELKIKFSSFVKLPGAKSVWVGGKKSKVLLRTPTAPH